MERWRDGEVERWRDGGSKMKGLVLCSFSISGDPVSRKAQNLLAFSNPRWECPYPSSDLDVPR